jgi:hypothetical protein
MSPVAGYNSVPWRIIGRCQRDTAYCDHLFSEEGSFPEVCRYLYLDKAWDRIDYLLSAERRAQTTFSRREDLFYLAIHGDGVLNAAVDVGYGPATFLSPQAVAQVAATLRPIDTKGLRKHWNTVKMGAAGVYGNLEGPGVWQYVRYYFEEFKVFYTAAADFGHAIIVSYG